MPDLAPPTMMGEDTAGCAMGLTGLRFPVGLKSYDTKAIRKLYNEMDDTFRKVPELTGTLFLLEGYSTQGVQAVDEKSTAFPHRSDKLVLTPYVMYAPNATIDPLAQAFGERMRQILLQASDDPDHLRAYVNYAHGTESVSAVYGFEDWRLEKLRHLKKKWDPENRMKYYVPIV